MLSALILTLLAAQPPVRLEADTSEYNSVPRTFILEGNVAVTREAGEDAEAITLHADRIEGALDGVIEATGNVSMTTGGVIAKARTGTYNLATSTGRFDDVTSQHDSWFIAAKSIQLTGPEQYVVEDCRVTSCDEVPSHYHFRVGRAKVKNGRVSMWGPRMYIGKVPVLWLPYVMIIPGLPHPPVRVRLGKSGFEGYFLKLSYLYNTELLGHGDMKADYRSRRGWAYGIENERAITRGVLKTDLYRIDERGVGLSNHIGRGVARFRYDQNYSDRVRGLGEIYYVTDGQFLEDYRFDEFVRNPDPQSGGALTYRGDAGAAMVRVVANANRSEYDLIERLPEVRAFLQPRHIQGGLYFEGAAGVTAFRHSTPYDSARIALQHRQSPDRSNLKSFARGDGTFAARRPTRIGAGWTATPYMQLDLLGYTEDTLGDRSIYRFLPALGMSLTNFFKFNMARNASYSIRPSFDFTARAQSGANVGQTPIVEHIDQLSGGAPLRMVLDQGLLTRGGEHARWRERLRLRLDGGYDFNPTGFGKRYLPIVGKVVAVLGDATNFDGSLTYDPNSDAMREARAEIMHTGRKLNASASYYRRRSDAGVPDFQNASGLVDFEVGKHWRGLFGASYDIELGRFDYARYGVTRILHDFVVSLEVTDQRLKDRFDFRVNVELKLP